MFAYAIVTGSILVLTLLLVLWSGFRQKEAVISLGIGLPMVLSIIYTSLRLAGISILPLGIVSIVLMSLLGAFALAMFIAGCIEDESEVVLAGTGIIMVVANTITYLGCAI